MYGMTIFSWAIIAELNGSSTFDIDASLNSIFDRVDLGHNNMSLFLLYVLAQ